MLREITISSGNWTEFASRIPELFHDPLQRGELTGRATYDGDIREECLVGVVLFRELYQWLYIEWVSLSLNYDIPDYAADLIWRVEETERRKGGLFGTFGLIYPGEEKLASWFRMAGFYFEEEDSNVYTLTLGEIEAEEFNKVIPSENVVEFHGAARELIRKMAANLNAEKMAYPIEEDIRENLYEGNLSLLYVEKGEPLGIILVSGDESGLCLDFMYAKSSQIAVCLLKTVLERARIFYPGSTRVLVPVLYRHSAKLVERFAPAAKRGRIKKAVRAYEIQTFLPEGLTNLL